ncbi:hypothetical protein BJ508DRAFT_345189 [Ascobolus immersus RN42]|uniref:Uncharacterized protein n=1 Tax=Ascobolus immersus RN42 TaxID=1160509 RepID=A0A3N4ID65_ASCIM|nr:hypothetical protein BJ508DRAFT_345189 [Ascobolus immersus RN42]
MANVLISPVLRLQLSRRDLLASGRQSEEHFSTFFNNPSLRLHFLGTLPKAVNKPISQQTRISFDMATSNDNQLPSTPSASDICMHGALPVSSSPASPAPAIGATQQPPSASVLPEAAPPSFPLRSFNSSLTLNTYDSLNSSNNSLSTAPQIRILDSPRFFGPFSTSQIPLLPTAPEPAATSTTLVDPTGGIWDGTNPPTAAPPAHRAETSYTCPHQPTSSPSPCPLCGDATLVDAGEGNNTFMQNPNRVIVPMEVEDPPHQDPRGLSEKIMDAICCPCVAIFAFVQRNERLKPVIVVFMITGTIVTAFLILFAASKFFSPEKVQRGWVGPGSAGPVDR